ncbi:hypothetical protein BDZ91DRAFT_798414 [Kalaharituber pfeilii]|nr:hypothetical protein BDZ91DRAFT_798414 [Kalaharituber pfeilii]
MLCAIPALGLDNGGSATYSSPNSCQGANRLSHECEPIPAENSQEPGDEAPITRSVLWAQFPTFNGMPEIAPTYTAISTLRESVHCECSVAMHIRFLLQHRNYRAAKIGALLLYQNETMAEAGMQMETMAQRAGERDRLGLRYRLLERPGGQVTRQGSWEARASEPGDTG